MSGQTYDDRATTAEPTGWTGWITFAGIMLILAGSLNAIYGLIAVFNDTWAVWGEEGVLFVDITGWGWAHVIIGAVAALCGIGLFSGNMVARVGGIVFASLSLIVNFLFIPVAPWWSLTIIALDVLVIWAIVVHGKEMKNI